jgi:hypothetical protein
MWSSRKPRTCAVGLDPLNGWPVTLTWTSGKAAQPCAGTSVQRAAAVDPCARRPSELTTSCLPLDTLVTRSAAPTSSNVQSAVRPGVLVAAIPPSGPAEGIAPSGP